MVGKLIEIKIDDGYFHNAPVVFHYTKKCTTDFWLISFFPEELDRILYLLIPISLSVTQFVNYMIPTLKVTFTRQT